jgi:hypothetical protein
MLHETEDGVAAAILGRSGGLVRSEKKAAAARRNGLRGGDPRSKEAKQQTTSSIECRTAKSRTPDYHGFARTDYAARCVSVGKSMMSPPPKHALNRFSYPFLPSWRNPPFAGAEMTGKNTGKALTLRRHSDRHVRSYFPRLQREIQRSVRLLATE